MGGGNYPQSKSMRCYSLNIKTEGHLLLPKIAWFLTYLKLKSEPYLELFTWIIHTAKVRGCTHQILNLRVMQCIHIAWFLRCSMLETGQKHINFRFVNMGGSKYLYSKSMWFYSLNIKPEGRILPYANSVVPYAKIVDHSTSHSLICILE